MRPGWGLLLAAMAMTTAPCAWARPHHLRAPRTAIDPAWQVRADGLAHAVFAQSPGDRAFAATGREPETDVAPPAALDTTPTKLRAVEPLRGLSSQGLWLRTGGDPRFSRLADSDGVAAGWPSMLSVSDGHYDIAFSPHAALGSSAGGESAEAGGMISLGAHLQDSVARRLSGLGIRQADPTAYGDRGRWFLFAAASGRAVGFNLVHDQYGFQRAGWSSEGSSAMISDAQAGLAWRRGPMQASFGYVHREIQTEAPINYGLDPKSTRDSMVAFSFSLAPH